MVILDLGVCPENYLEVRNGIRLEMPKVEFLGRLTGVSLFDIEVGIIFLKLEQLCYSIDNLYAKCEFIPD